MLSPFAPTVLTLDTVCVIVNTLRSRKEQTNMSKVTSIRKDIETQVERIREKLKDRVYSKVAEATGLHVNTVRNMANNSGQKFSLLTIEKLEKYFQSEKK
jgi:hypothetical protein